MNVFSPNQKVSISIFITIISSILIGFGLVVLFARYVNIKSEIIRDVINILVFIFCYITGMIFNFKYQRYLKKKDFISTY